MVKQSRYRPGVAQKVGGGIALLFHDHGTRRGSGQQHAPAVLYPRKRPGTHCTGGWVGPRAGLDRYGKSRPNQDSIPGPSSPSSVAIPTELPGPPIKQIRNKNSLSIDRTYYRVFKSPSFVPILNQMNPLYSHTTSIIILPSTPRSSPYVLPGNKLERPKLCPSHKPNYKNKMFILSNILF
jgi:hypothetical protein